MNLAWVVQLGCKGKTLITTIALNILRTEPGGDGDENDHWSADDDNIVLQEIKSEKKESKY